MEDFNEKQLTDINELKLAKLLVKQDYHISRRLINEVK